METKAKQSLSFVCYKTDETHDTTQNDEADEDRLQICSDVVSEEKNQEIENREKNTQVSGKDEHDKHGESLPGSRGKKGRPRKDETAGADGKNEENGDGSYYCSKCGKPFPSRENVLGELLKVAVNLNYCIRRNTRPGRLQNKSD